MAALTAEEQEHRRLCAPKRPFGKLPNTERSPDWLNDVCLSGHPCKIPQNLVPERLVQQNPQTRPVRLVVLDALHVQLRHHGRDEHELR